MTSNAVRDRRLHEKIEESLKIINPLNHKAHSKNRFNNGSLKPLYKSYGENNLYEMSASFGKNQQVNNLRPSFSSKKMDIEKLKKIETLMKGKFEF